MTLARRNFLQTLGGAAVAGVGALTPRQLAAEQEVQVYCLYALSNDIADTILEMAVTHGVTQLVMGTSQRGGLWRRTRPRRACP